MRSHRPTDGPARIARIDLGALQRNLARLADGLGTWFLDARADAFGHGLTSVATVASAAGAAGVRVSDGEVGPETDEFPAGFLGSWSGALGRHVLGPAAYGLDPEVDTEPVLTLVAEVIQLKPTPAGSGVSYGYTYVTASDTALALVGLGYADGLPRLASNRAEVRIGGTRRPVVGRIAMDQLVVDAGDAETERGDEVVVFGAASDGAPTAIEWAAWTERTPLQLTAGLGRRIHRSIIGTGAEVRR